MLHFQGERRFGPGRLGEQVQQIPLRHHRDVRVRLIQPSKVDQGQLPAGHVDAQVVDPALRNLGKFIPQPEVTYQPQGAGMHCVATEVAKEVGVLLQQGDLDPGSGQ